MIGELLEFRIACGPLAQAVEFFRALGFLEIEGGDSLAEPGVALANGEIAIRIVESSERTPVIAFVRPNLKDHLRGLRRRRVELEFAELADDQFHRAAFRDPNGQLVMLSEAGTRSPPARHETGVSVVGRFLEYSVPTHSVAESASFWGGLGLHPNAEGTEPAAWIRVRGRGLTLGFHEGARFVPGLCFECRDLESRAAYLEATGCPVRRGLPFGTSASGGVTIDVPGNQAVYLISA